MTDYEEEQKNEVEALESIYPTEFEILMKEPCYQFSIALKSDNYEESTDDGACCTLIFTYVPTYPDAVPIIEVGDYDNLDEEHVTELQEMLQKEAEDNVGMVMIFTLVSTAQEWLNTKLDEIEKNREEEAERKLREKEEAERQRFEGTRVSVETFLLWKATFDAEMAALKKKIQKEEPTSKKLTGRELFERDSTLNESDIQFMQEGEEEIKVDESLFQELDDLDLDDELKTLDDEED